MPNRTTGRKLLLWGFLRLVLFSGRQQFACGKLEELGDVEHGPQGGTLLSAFHLSYIAEVVAKGMSKIFLSHAALDAQFRDCPPESLFGGMGNAFNGCSDGSGHKAMVPGSADL